ncbi:MAG: MmcQ/YjbR family DNA-binding protein [Verrucomicrobiota bacterium]|nr:MmcQ/YjbR family DNA-binding protein [Verrucomicrobiota bacterium]
MTAAEFRDLALRFPEASESAHMGHPDFRVNGKIFATLGYPDGEHGVVILPLEEQSRFVATDPTAFAPVTGGWGARGATQVRLPSVKNQTLYSALALAWRKRAPKRLGKRQLPMIE